MKKTLLWSYYLLWKKIVFLNKFSSITNKSHCKNKQILLVAWDFPPRLTSGIYRPVSLYKYGKEMGWNISVVAGSYDSKTDSLAKDILKSLPKGLMSYVKKKCETENLLFPQVHENFLNALSMVARAKDLSKKIPPSIVMATGPPFHDFIAGYFLSRYYNAKLVLDYRDEWTENPFRSKNKKDDLYWESLCLKTADLVIFTTKSQLDHQLSVFPGLKPKKCLVIPNGWEPSDFVNTEKIIKKKKKITVSFIGYLGWHIALKNFLEILKITVDNHSEFTKDLKVKFIGKKVEYTMSQLNAFPYQDMLEINDHIQKKQSNQMMQEQTALLMINSERFNRYIPGKLYDYLASGSPILVFGDYPGEINQIIKNLGAGIIIDDDDPKQLEEALRKLTNTDRSRWNNEKRKEWVGTHTREEMAKKMIDAFERLIKDENY